MEALRDHLGVARMDVLAHSAGTNLQRSKQAIAPFYYGHWDEAARAHRAAEDGHQNKAAAADFSVEGAFGPDATRTALAAFGQPVLLLAGEVDLNSPPRAMAEYTGLFPNAQLVIQPGAGHFPWLDDADRFVATTAAFLG